MTISPLFAAPVLAPESRVPGGQGAPLRLKAPWMNVDHCVGVGMAADGRRVDFSSLRTGTPQVAARRAWEGVQLQLPRGFSGVLDLKDPAGHSLGKVVVEAFGTDRFSVRSSTLDVRVQGPDELQIAGRVPDLRCFLRTPPAMRLSRVMVESRNGSVQTHESVAGQRGASFVVPSQFDGALRLVDDKGAAVAQVRLEKLGTRGARIDFESSAAYTCRVESTPATLQLTVLSR